MPVMKIWYNIVLISLFVLAALLSCKNYSKTEPQQTKMDSFLNSTMAYTDSAHYRGARLIASNDCITCHSIDKKMFGPSFMQIAAKYHNNEKLANYLTGNVIKGSRGLYGNNAMTPHPNIKYTDLVEMIKYILSLKQAT
jgi:cytochrome c